MESLHVFREFLGEYQHVGKLSGSDREPSPSSSESPGASAAFTYDPSYLAGPRPSPLSAILPLREEPFSTESTRSFFEGLLPEGSMRRLLDSATHGSAHDYVHLISRLNNESVGALVFSKDEQINLGEQRYVALDSEDLLAYARQPSRVALELNMESRLSLAGAQTKVGLYHWGDDPFTGWFLPKGAAPSTHIVKVQTPESPYMDETLNEAICLSTARACGFDVADYLLVGYNGAPPLLAVRRFDRVFCDQPTIIDGLPLPTRLHQEDFCQAACLPTYAKYEPTDGRYLSLCASIIAACSSNPFGDRMMMLDSVLFDFLIGNCDNHLKNHSFLWNRSWGLRELSPLYDIACTTIYPQIYREMGIALCPSRRIDDVTKSDIVAVGQSIGVGEQIVWRHYCELRDGFLDALNTAEDYVTGLGFEAAHRVARLIRDDAIARIRQVGS